MFRIRRVFDDVLPANRQALDAVAELLLSQFNAISQAKLARIPDLLRNPLKHRFRSVVYVAEDARGKVHGAALFNHEPEIAFCYLDYLASDKGLSGRGIGGALYQRVREEAALLRVSGLFFECLPDEPALCRDPAMLRQNRARLRFYEHYGARPIANTAYETPVKPGTDNPPFLVFDDLGQGTVLRREHVQKVMTCVLERKYREVCGPEYVRLVVESVRDDPVPLRSWRYTRRRLSSAARVSAWPLRIALVAIDRHENHRVRDRGYVEAPVRVRTILHALARSGAFETVAPRLFADQWLAAVHDRAYLAYLKKICGELAEDEEVYPYVFPIRNRARPPLDLPIRAGYYCLDTFTPLSRNAYLAARRAVDCALTAAHEISAGRRCAYALVRPPGHHAERAFFGGFCYFNNAAIAAEYLSRYGRVAMLDVDYHHGNGQQQIFYERDDVLTISLHGHPSFAYPYFSGFADEHGAGRGLGLNLNLPLPEKIDAVLLLQTLERALTAIRRFAPVYLVVCLGLDTAQGDPTGSWPLRAADFQALGERIGGLGRPTLVVQEGGYDNRTIGANARAFFAGLLRPLAGAALRTGAQQRKE